MDQFIDVACDECILNHSPRIQELAPNPLDRGCRCCGASGGWLALFDEE